MSLLLKIFATVLTCDGQINLPLVTVNVHHTVIVIIL